jgi:hypothetical protein
LSAPETAHVVELNLARKRHSIHPRKIDGPFRRVPLRLRKVDFCYEPNLWNPRRSPLGTTAPLRPSSPFCPSSPYPPHHVPTRDFHASKRIHFALCNLHFAFIKPLLYRAFLLCTAKPKFFFQSTFGPSCHTQSAGSFRGMTSAPT